MNQSGASGRRGQSKGKQQRTQVFDAASQRIDDFLDFQNRLTSAAEDMVRYWADRTKAQAELASALMSKLASTQSAPEATAAYQQFLSECANLAMEDGRRVLSEARTLTETMIKTVTRFNP